MTAQHEDLKRRARRLYGTPCTQIFCSGCGGQPNNREVYIQADEDIRPRRVDDGYLVTITVFVPDENES